MNNKNKIIIFILVLYSIFTFIVTLNFENIPVIPQKGFYVSESFWEGIIINMHSSLIDFIMLTLIVSYFTSKIEKERSIKQYKNNIDDVRHWFKEEATLRIVANIKRLNELEYYKLDLTKCYLKEAHLKGVNLSSSLFMGSNMELINLEKTELKECNFKGVNLKKSKCNSAIFTNSKMRNIKCYDSNFIGANFTGCDFMNSDLSNSDFKSAIFKYSDLKGVIYKDSNFERVNFIGASNIDIDKIIECKSLKYAKFDKDIEGKIKKINPTILEK